MISIGIDPGTSRGRVAVVQEGRPRLLADAEGRNSLGATVALTDDGRLYAGDAARAERRQGYSFRGYKARLGQGGFGGPSPRRLMSALIQALVQRAADSLAETPRSAVITVPAGAGDAAREALQGAAHSAGLEVIRLLPEASAAAMAWLMRQRSPGRFALFDLGAGRFDVTLFQAHGDTLEVLGRADDSELGGDALDRALARGLLELEGVPLPSLSHEAALLAVEAARLARRALTERYAARFRCDLDGLPISRPLSRDQMETVLKPWLDRLYAPCREAMLNADVRPGALDAVVLIGGAARMPLVRRIARDAFQVQPTLADQHESMVAQGAAIQADLMAGAQRSGLARVLDRHLLVIEAAPWDVALESVDGALEVLIPRGSPLPASATRRFSTHLDQQQRVDIPLVINRDRPRWLCCDGLTAAPAGEARVDVTIMVDLDGRLRWSACAADTGEPLPISPMESTDLSIAAPGTEVPA